MKDKVLKLLKQKKKLSTSRVAGYLGIDYNYCLKLLNELLEEKKVKREEETLATYWSLK